MVAVNLRYPAPSSPLVLLLRVPGDTHPRRHVIVHVSSDWASALEVLVLIFFLDGDRSKIWLLHVSERSAWSGRLVCRTLEEVYTSIILGGCLLRADS